jgi:predicted metal-binding membrane protein
MRVALAVLSEIAWGGCWPIMAVSAAAWMLVIGLDGRVLVPSFCLSMPSTFPIDATALAAAISINDWREQAFCWAAMLLAMMTPLIWQPLTHVWERSLTERRVRAVLLFFAGYIGIWMACMAILALAALALRVAAGSAIAAFAIAVGLAALWQMTPVKARFLRRCHVLRPLPAFGLAADIASFRFGIEISRSCIVTCWALMLLPLTSDFGQIPIMGSVGLLMLFERYSGRTLSFRLACINGSAKITPR